MDARPLAEVRQDLSKYVDEAVRTHARVDITRNGKRAAVLLAAEDFDTLLETLDVLSDEALVRQVHDSLRQADQSVPAEQAYAEFKARRSHGAA